jgi:hypothetical protein
METRLADELARQIWRNGGLDRFAGERIGAFSNEHSRFVVGGDEERFGRQSVDLLDETLEEGRLVWLVAEHELHLASEVSAGRHRSNARFGHCIDGHSGTTDCADHPGRAVMIRVVAQADEQDRQTRVEGGRVGRTEITLWQVTKEGVKRAPLLRPRR